MWSPFLEVLYKLALFCWFVPSLDRFSKTSWEAKLIWRRPKMENGDYLRLFLLEIPAWCALSLSAPPCMQPCLWSQILYFPHKDPLFFLLKPKVPCWTTFNTVSSIPAGEPGRPLLLQVAELSVALVLELRLLPHGDDVHRRLRGHCLCHRRRSGLPGSLPSRRLGE